MPDPKEPLSPIDREAALRTRTWSDNLRAEEPAPPSAQDNPNLRQQVEQNARFNARAHEVLAEIPVPQGLRDKILAQQKIVVVPYWRTPRAIALAAAMAFLATGLLFWIIGPREDRTFAGFRSRMVSFALREYRMDIHTRDLAEVQSFLRKNGAPSAFELPTALAQTPIKGGATLFWQGKPVSMVCFDRLNTTLYMFVVDSPSGPIQTAQVESFKNIGTATWTSGNKTFLLAGSIPLEELARLVKS